MGVVGAEWGRRPQNCTPKTHAPVTSPPFVPYPIPAPHDSPARHCFGDRMNANRGGGFRWARHASPISGSIDVLESGSGSIGAHSEAHASPTDSRA